MTNDHPIEIVRPQALRSGWRAVLFDFDGTLSLLRRNWQDVMIPMMVRHLQATGTDETPQQLHRHVEDFVMRLNGRQTIYQMIQLADEVRRRGGEPQDPLQYKRQYHELLWQQVSVRVEAVRSGRVPPERMAVPGSRQLLQSLQQRRLPLYLASGTDQDYVRDELHVLGLASFFEPHIYGALDDYQKFSKAIIIRRMIEDTQIGGEQILGFGDGFVEIEEIKKVGGLAVGVASNEQTREGINAWKRQRLIRAGADVILGDYRPLNRLLEILQLGS